MSSITEESNSKYSQIKKTTQGLGMYNEDLPIAGSYTDSGNLRFTAEEDTLSKVQAGIFGRWANDEAQAYVDSEFKTIRKENIDELLDLGMKSSEYRKLKEKIKDNLKALLLGGFIVFGWLITSLLANLIPSTLSLPIISVIVVVK